MESLSKPSRLTWQTGTLIRDSISGKPTGLKSSAKYKKEGPLLVYHSTTS